MGMSINKLEKIGNEDKKISYINYINESEDNSSAIRGLYNTNLNDESIQSPSITIISETKIKSVSSTNSIRIVTPEKKYVGKTGDDCYKVPPMEMPILEMPILNPDT